jgi:ribose transport system ATP-binding protein
VNPKREVGASPFSGKKQQPGGAPLLEMRDIRKSFGATRAVQGVSFECCAGEVHALVGENGAGKSTLLKILAGVYRADGGEIFMDGKSVQIHSPRQAQALGIAVMYQEFNLIPPLPVSANILLGREPVGMAGMVDRNKMDRDCRALAKSLGITIDPQTATERLRPAQQQLVEILKALSFGGRIVVMDEPTAALAPSEVDGLLDIVRLLKAEGHGVIFVSHRLREVGDIADRITVLKDGRKVSTLSAAEANPEKIVSLMVGRPLQALFPERRKPAAKRALLRVKQLGGRVFHGIDLELNEGEVVGLFGLEGHGQRELARALGGWERYQTGSLELAGEEVRIHHPKDAIHSGISFVCDDRKVEGLVLEHSVRSNISLPVLRDLSKLGFVDRKQERARAAELIRLLSVKLADSAQPVGELSGGNQQKVAIGRALVSKPKVLILHEPTRGVDVGAKVEIYRLIGDLAEKGAAILVVSSDLLEIIGLSDRVLTIRDGHITKEIAGKDATEETIMWAAVHQEEASGVAEEPKKPADQQAKKRRSLPQTAMAFFVLIGLILITSIFSPSFRTVRNFSNLIEQTLPLGIAALGQTFVIMTAGIDLSAGSAISFVVAILSYVMAGTLGVTGSIVLVFFVGVAVGLINGLAVTKLRLSPLIVTLAMLSILQGLALQLRPAPGGQVPDAFMDALTGQLGPVAMPLVLWVIFATLGIYLLQFTRFGAHLYAVGGQERCAYLSGVNTDRVKIGAYVVSGISAAAAGIYLAARIGSGDPLVGQAYTLDSITAVVVGGTSLYGGRGSAVNTIVGAFIVGLLSNALNQLGVTSFYQYIFKGILLILAVFIYSRGRTGVAR